MNAMTKSAAELRRAARDHIRLPRLETPFHDRLMALSEVNDWYNWAGYKAPHSLFDGELEYFAIRSTAALFDISPMVKYRITGADAERYLNRPTLGVHLGPRSPTSLLGLYYRLTGDVAGKTGGQYVPSGGMASVAPAFVRAAEKAGVTIRCGTPVGRILADRGRTSGVVTRDGTEITAPIVVSAIHPQTTFLNLVDPAESGTGFVRSVKNVRSYGNVAKLDLALDSVPNFEGLPAAARNGRIVLVRSMQQVESAFNPAKYGEFSTDPVMEITLPSLADPSLALAGGCTLSALVQYAPYRLKAGWEAGKPAFLKIVLETLERHAPGIGKSVVAASLMTPVDIEAEYNLPGGHWHHGELQADQLLINRPTSAASGYKTPIEGLYLASAGAHPGGGISGLPGWNAARHILSGAKA